MQSIRSFVAVPLSGALQASVSRVISSIAEPKDGVKWVPVDNLHLTLKFLGDVDNRDVPQVCDVIRQCCEGQEAFDLHFRGLGGFPDLQRARVLWAGITEGGEVLTELVARLEARFADLGFKPEHRDYRPHLTLGRARSGRRVRPEVAERVAAQQDRDLGRMQADEVRLYASFLDRSGPSYHVMDTVELE